ncbi:MAG: nickel-dependent hydrogenase large subunit [Maricaulaceae bacterium]
MNAAAADLGRRYQAHVSPQDAWVTPLGPANPLAVARGRSTQDGVELAALLFPVCPRAQGLAALRAAEAALGLPVSPQADQARERLALAEAVAQAVWRAALTWPSLLGAAPDPAPVQTARAASAALERALFDGPWQVLGGVEPRDGGADARQAIADLGAALDAVAAQAEAVTRAAEAQTLSLGAASPLQDRIAERALTPDAVCLEESPRALAADDETRLAARFRAQHRHARTLWARLRDGTPPTTSATKPGGASGVGLGVVMTARGRLRHIMRIDAGRIADWRADAPTDWNFAPRGPVAQALKTAAAGAQPETARWILTAFDPCAPFEVVRHA